MYSRCKTIIVYHVFKGHNVKKMIFIDGYYMSGIVSLYNDMFKLVCLEAIFSLVCRRIISIS